ncbi:MAG: LacI family DNA-binding transcriptional regulator [Verrucomicrobia bacterium]|nr:LacI family DNA-binding transcriptional regulator [Verrucomicrobiota bacterium]MBV9274675.1 LacI family DNA-binding transcriptional regulator [Verrucomicrobiota bacterium]
MNATIRSVAKLAGVASSTVSHFLNRTAPLSAATALCISERDPERQHSRKISYSRRL